jgi:hypothetical protein
MKRKNKTLANHQRRYGKGFEHGQILAHRQVTELFFSKTYLCSRPPVSARPLAGLQGEAVTPPHPQFSAVIQGGLFWQKKYPRIRGTGCSPAPRKGCGGMPPRGEFGYVRADEGCAPNRPPTTGCQFLDSRSRLIFVVVEKQKQEIWWPQDKKW